MFTPTDIAQGILTWAELTSATILEQKQTIDSQAEEIEAMKLMLSPPAVVPIPPVIVRDVTHIEMEDDPA
jgi:hypothetical protein